MCWKHWQWIIAKLYRKTNYVIQNNSILAIYWYTILFSHWLFWLKYCRFSTVVRVYYILKNVLFHRKVICHLFSRYLRFCISRYPMICQICDIMTGIRTWGRVHFWIYLLNHNSLSHQTWPIDRYSQGQ